MREGERQPVVWSIVSKAFPNRKDRRPLKRLSWGPERWRGGLVVTSPCSYKVPGFDFQNPHRSSQTFCSIVLEDPVGTYVVHIHAC